MKLPWVWTNNPENFYEIDNSPNYVRKVLRDFIKGRSNLTKTFAYISTLVSTDVDIRSWNACYLYYQDLKPEHKAVIDNWYNMVAARLEDVI